MEASIGSDPEIPDWNFPGRLHASGRMSRYHANSDYSDMDSHPIRLEAGDLVRTGGKDQTWPGWVWAIDQAGNDGYVPEEILEDVGEGEARAMDGFDPTVLTVRRGDALESLRQIHGWHWCRNSNGEEGWVAGYLLKPVEP